MGQVTIDAATPPAWRLDAAVLVYRATEGLRHGGAAYATVHKVVEQRGRPALGEGTPATREASAQLARALGEASALSGFIPPQLVYLGVHSLAWWRPAGPATLFFDCAKSAAADQPDDKSGAALIGKRSGRCMQPALLFAVTAGRWYVFAIRDARPGPDTRLARAPYFNVWSDGAICTGNVRLPRSLSPAALEQYERAFFDSEFTHPNLHGAARLVRHKAGAYAFWRERLDAPQDAPFPAEKLVGLDTTLGALVKRLETRSARD